MAMNVASQKVLNAMQNYFIFKHFSRINITQLKVNKSKSQVSSIHISCPLMAWGALTVLVQTRCEVRVRFVL